MDFCIQFTFSQKSHDALVFFDYKIESCCLFVFFEEGDELTKKFGDDISIETDLEKMLPMEHSYPEMEELRVAVFEAIKKTPEFKKIKVLYPNSKRDCDPNNKA